MSTRRPLRRRGQGAAEFSLVAPVFFLIFGGFLLFSLWMLNGLVIEGSARNSARYAGAQFADYLSFVAAHPIIFTASPDGTGTGFFSELPDPDAGDGTTAYDSSISSAFAARNDQTQPGYVYRLGWDWGILQASADKITAAFDATAAYLAQNATHMFGGIPAGTVAHICLLDVLPAAGFSPDESYCASSALASVSVDLAPGGGYAMSAEGSVPDPQAAPAPRYVRVELEMPLVRWSAIPLAALVAPDNLIYRVSATERLGRIEPACPIPVDDTSALATGCGIAYPPDPSVP